MPHGATALPSTTTRGSQTTSNVNIHMHLSACNVGGGGEGGGGGGAYRHANHVKITPLIISKNQTLLIIKAFIIQVYNDMTITPHQKSLSLHANSCLFKGA